MRIKDIMTTPVITVHAETALKAAAKLLIEHRISALPVVDQHGELVGILSEADLLPLESSPDARGARSELPGGKAPHRVEEVMTRDVITLEEGAGVTLAARWMLERGVKRIPIVSGSHVVGIVSRRDILKVLIRSDDEIRAEIEDMVSDGILMLGRFTVDVRDGEVSLGGPVDRSGRRLVELLARTVPGVVSVRFADED